MIAPVVSRNISDYCFIGTFLNALYIVSKNIAGKCDICCFFCAKFATTQLNRFTTDVTQSLFRICKQRKGDPANRFLPRFSRENARRG